MSYNSLEEKLSIIQRQLKLYRHMQKQGKNNYELTRKIEALEDEERELLEQLKVHV